MKDALTIGTLFVLGSNMLQAKYIVGVFESKLQVQTAALCLGRVHFDPLLQTGVWSFAIFLHCGPIFFDLRSSKIYVFLRSEYSSVLGAEHGFKAEPGQSECSGTNFCKSGINCRTIVQHCSFCMEYFRKSHMAIQLLSLILFVCFHYVFMFLQCLFILFKRIWYRVWKKEYFTD